MNTETTQISIELPLPIDVVATLMNLIGSAYPASTISNNEHYGRTMKFNIPNSARAKKLSKATVAKLKQDSNDLEDFTVTKAGADGFAWATPAHIADMCRAVMESAFEINPEGQNYLEWKLQPTGGGKPYVLTFGKSERQTPHDLRMAAEEKLTAAEARIAELEATR